METDIANAAEVEDSTMIALLKFSLTLFAFIAFNRDGMVWFAFIAFNRDGMEWFAFINSL